MTRMARLGHQVVIVTSDSNALASVPVLDRTFSYQRVDGMDLWWVRTFKYRVAKSLRRMISWLDFELKLLFLPVDKMPRPDAVIVSSLSLFTILNGLRLRRRFRCKLVFEVRDIWPLTIIEEGGFSRWNPVVMMLAWVERLGYRKADLVVGTMPNLGQHVEETLGYARPTACIPMGVDAEAERTGSDPGVSEEWVARHLPKDKFIVAYAGTIGITNALDTFLACAERMVHESGVHFVLVGAGDMKATYEARYGALPNVTFAPRVSSREVASVLARCDLLYFAVHDSKVWRYGQSLNKVINYMLSGKPVVASFTGFPSMLDESGCGVFIPSKDVEALAREIDRFRAMPPAERERIGALGRRWILDNRDFEVLARRYLHLMFDESAPNQR